jgi:hypothetical protein
MSAAQPQRPTTGDRAAGGASWQAQGTPWCPETELDAERPQRTANIAPALNG